ncbi:MAG TPA: hypothetical protein VFL36_22335 [Myxococcales bacterium]|nr:hypothetical protein [Myxococcales bacterium]
MTTLPAACIAAALLAALPRAARAAPPALDDASPAPSAGLARRGWSPRYGEPWFIQPQARQGPLVSFGLGGGSLYLSSESPVRMGAADVDFRLGYGFSDRFQMFMDFNADAGSTYQGANVGSWTWTVRGQTLLAGDRAGNGLNVNFGAGFGGLISDGSRADRSAGPTGFALAGGLSYDARITPWFAISPEFFVTWHQVPNLPGIPDDVASIYGLRLNLLWYLR